MNIKRDATMLIKDAELKTNILAINIKYFKDLAADCCILPAQLECLENFACDIIAIADAEISYSKNMQRIELLKYKQSLIFLKRYF